jgi:hypothetical protein
MTKITKPVRRETLGTVYEQGKHRPVIVSIEPPNVIGFRLKGTRRTYRLTTDALYLNAVQAHVAAEKREQMKARRANRR